MAATNEDTIVREQVEMDAAGKRLGLERRPPLADGGGPLARSAVAALVALAEVDGEPTAEQRAALTGWPGWGPLAPVFKYLEGGEAAAWAPTRRALTDLTSREEWDAGQKVTDN